MPKDGFEKQCLKSKPFKTHPRIMFTSSKSINAFEPDMFTAFVSFCLH